MVNITKFEQQHKDLDTLRAMAAVAVQSGKYTADYNHATVLNIFMTARALGVDPMLALNGGFNIIKGKINMGAHFMVALARRAGHSIKVVEMTAQKCIIIAKRKDNEDSLKYEMDWAEASQAGLTNKDNWQKNPKQMLYCACMRNIFRMLFCDIAIPYDADEMGEDTQIPLQTDLESAIFVETTSDPSDEKEPLKIDLMKPNDEFKEELERRLKEKGVDCSSLDEWLQLRSMSISKPFDEIVKNCLDKFDGFKIAFERFLKSKETAPAPSA